MAEPTAGQLVTTSIRLLQPLGAGGMGSVWLAEHLALRTQVVVKFIAEELARNPEAVARFTREAAAASQVKSPHVVQTLDHGIMESGVPFIVMELLEGHDLATHLEQNGILDPAEASEIVTQLARALMRAHERGIVHRDIKPNNIFLCDAGSGELFVKLLDFGIAKGLGHLQADEKTKTGSTVGSPYYMSPEQVVGAKDIDYRSDLWSVGVVTYEALVGKKPFDAETVGGLALKIHNDPLPTPSQLNTALPKSFDAWFFRACSREVQGRFTSAKELADALAAAVTGKPAASFSIAPNSAENPSALPEAALANTVVDALPSRSDPKARTDAGVGFTPRREPRSRTGVVLIAVGLVVVAVGVGFAVPRLLRSSALPEHTATAEPAGQPQPSAIVTAQMTPTHVETTTAPPQPTVTSKVVPMVKGTRPAPSQSAAPVPTPSVAAPPVTTATTTAKPAHPNEEDIK